MLEVPEVRKNVDNILVFLNTNSYHFVIILYAQYSTSLLIKMYYIPLKILLDNYVN